MLVGSVWVGEAYVWASVLRVFWQRLVVGGVKWGYICVFDMLLF